MARGPGQAARPGGLWIRWCQVRGGNTDLSREVAGHGLIQARLPAPTRYCACVSRTGLCGVG
jgi:hypothetical protein